MAYFSESDINEAKKRVFEMQNKASFFRDSIDNNIKPTPKKEESPQKQNNESNSEESTEKSDSKDSSLFVILALILLLSKEEADHSLILALLYLLF